MNKIVDVLMKRDDMTQKEAKDHLKCVREMMNDAIESGDYFEAEEIMYNELGLELDYIFDVL